MPEALERRTHVYVQRPKIFGLSGCKCGNDDPDWSEYKGHLWCPSCQIDFAPEDSGVFDGPIPIQCSAILGIFFDTIDLASGKLQPDPIGHVHFFQAEDGTFTQIYDPLFVCDGHRILGVKENWKQIAEENEKRTGNHDRDRKKVLGL